MCMFLLLCIMNNWPLALTYDKRCTSLVEIEESNLNQKNEVPVCSKNEIETLRNFKKKAFRTADF